MNLGYPINTADNDMGYYPIDSTQGLYFGVRPAGAGGMDIYSVKNKSLPRVDTRTMTETTTIAVEAIDPFTFSQAQYDAMLRELRDSLQAHPLPPLPLFINDPVLGKDISISDSLFLDNQ